MQHIVITGANRGIGLELARQYIARPETRVYALCRKPDEASALHSLAKEAAGRVAERGSTAVGHGRGNLAAFLGRGRVLRSAFPEEPGEVFPEVIAHAHEAGHDGLPHERAGTGVDIGQDHRAVSGW